MKSKVCGVCGLQHRRLGVTISHNVLKRTALESKHLLRILDAWSFAAPLVEAHSEVRKIVVYAVDSGQTYSIDRERFLTLATRQTFNAWHGPQLALPRRMWDAPADRQAAEHVEPEHVERREIAQTPIQTGFWSYTATRSA